MLLCLRLAVCLCLSNLLSLITTPIPRQTSYLPFWVLLLILECFMLPMSLILIFPLLPILAFVLLCIVNSHFQCQHISIFSPFTMDCLQVIELRSVSKLPIILSYTFCSTKKCWWWYLPWWTFFLKITLLHNHCHIITTIDMIKLTLI